MQLSSTPFSLDKPGAIREHMQAMEKAVSDLIDGRLVGDIERKTAFPSYL